MAIAKDIGQVLTCAHTQQRVNVHAGFQARANTSTSYNNDPIDVKKLAATDNSLVQKG